MQAALDVLAKHVAYKAATSDAQRAEINAAPADCSLLPSNLVHSDALREFDRTATADFDGRCQCCSRDLSAGRVLMYNRGRAIYARTCTCTITGTARHLRADWCTSYVDGFLLGRVFVNYSSGSCTLQNRMFYDADHEHVVFLLEYYQHAYVIKMTYVTGRDGGDGGGAANASHTDPTVRFEIVGIYALGDASQPIVFGMIDSVWYASVGVALLKYFRATDYAALPASFRAKLDQIPSPRALVDQYQHVCPCCGDISRATFGLGCQCSIDGMLIVMISCVAYNQRTFKLNDHECKWFLEHGDDDEAGAEYGHKEVLYGVSWTGRALIRRIMAYPVAQDDDGGDDGDESQSG